MKKIICFVVAMFSLFSIKSEKVNGNDYSQYVNRAYIVLNGSDNTVVEGKNINLIRSVASVSKIMTAVLAIESEKLDQEVIIISEDINTYGSSIYLQVGDKLTLRDLVYGLMLRSGNDAAKAIARVVGESVENFSLMMNDKARKIGMKNSNFNNPSGLDVNEIGNLSTAYDLAVLMSYAINNETFLEISGSKQYRCAKGTWANKNKLLYSYDKLIGGKTGFTYKAKRTLVTAAKDGDTRFIVVTLDCGNDFNFHRFLYERNFNKYQTQKVLEGGANYFEEYEVICQNPIFITLEKDKLDSYSLKYLLSDNIAEVFLNDGDVSKKVGVCSVKKVESFRSNRSFWEKIKDLFK